MTLNLGDVAERIDAGADPRTAASEALDECSPWEIRELAVAYVIEHSRAYLRDETRDAEREAQHLKDWVAKNQRDRQRRANRVHYEPDPAINERFYAKMTALLNDYKEQCRMEWTADLLASSFALADGTRVLWGEATVRQHQQRIDLLTKNAAGNLQTAARHQLAIDALNDAHVSTLNELPEAA